VTTVVYAVRRWSKRRYAAHDCSLCPLGHGLRSCCDFRRWGGREGGRLAAFIRVNAVWERQTDRQTALSFGIYTADLWPYCEMPRTGEQTTRRLSVRRARKRLRDRHPWRRDKRGMASIMLHGLVMTNVRRTGLHKLGYDRITSLVRIWQGYTAS
jgi:hypothetical protein